MIYYENQRSKQDEYLYFQTDRDLSFVKHFHNSYEFLFVTDGEMECEIESTSYTLTKGKAIIIFPNQPHNYRTKEHSVSHLVIFSKDFVNSFHKEVKSQEFINPVIHYNDNNHYALLKQKGASKFLCKSILYEICDKFYRNSKLRRSKETQDELATQIVSYIQENFKEKITLKSIAKDFNYNYSYLSNYFNKTFHCSFSTFLNTFRLDYALYQLEHTEEKIISISSASGFSTIRAFNIAFKEKYRVSPREYREHC